MQITIHRGTHQIGGTCIEVRAGDDRVMLDLGLPLPVDGDEPSIDGKSVAELVAEGVLPRIAGLYDDDAPSVRAVLMSHVHQDHLGLAPRVHPDIPVYATDGTWALLDALRVFVPRPDAIANRQILPKRQPLSFGALSVTAVPVDHSAPDAVALVIEGLGKRLLYTGDLRAHGRKGRLFDDLARQYAGRIDALLIEGTTIGRAGAEMESETALERRLLELLTAQTHFALIFCSAQNIDRLVTVNCAVKRQRKIMVIDLYTAYTLHRLQCISSRLPQWDWQEVRIVPWGFQQERLREAGYTEFLDATQPKWINWKEMERQKERLVLLLRSNRKVKDLEEHFGDAVREMRWIWSQWDGYWPDDRYVRPLCERHGIERVMLHTSGHAAWADIRRMIKTIDPGVVIPVHTQSPEHFARHVRNVRLPQDGEIIAV